jgi:hypothetical protein
MDMHLQSYLPLPILLTLTLNWLLNAGAGSVTLRGCCGQRLRGGLAESSPKLRVQSDCRISPSRSGGGTSPVVEHYR